MNVTVNKGIVLAVVVLCEGDFVFFSLYVYTHNAILTRMSFLGIFPFPSSYSGMTLRSSGYDSAYSPELQAEIYICVSLADCIIVIVDEKSGYVVLRGRENEIPGACCHKKGGGAQE